MIRFIVVTCILLTACGFDAMGASYDSMPPPRELRSLAEQLAPLIKQNPELPRPGQKSGHAPEAVPVDSTETAASEPRPPSPVEEGFSQRAGRNLVLFGYEQIGRQIGEAPMTGGEVQDDVVLGPGDRVAVTFRGQRDDSKTYQVGSQGQMIIDGMEPIAASGLALGDLRGLIEREAARNLLNTTVFVSVKSLRQVSVTVMGEVARPGVYTLGPLQTVLDALALAGGINPNGSLRAVRLLRGGRVIPLDFYKLLLEGDLGAPLILRGGDKIMVPVLGQTVAVSGDVKRPGIFERARGRADFTFGEILELAGGPRQPGANRFVKLSLTPQGDEQVRDLAPGDVAGFADGDMLMVTAGQPMRTNGIQILGHVRQPGPRDVMKTPDLKTLLANPRLLREGAYALIGVIERQDPRNLATELLEFSPLRVMRGSDTLRLVQGDRVLFFSTAEIARVMRGAAKRKKTKPGPGLSHGLTYPVKRTDSERDLFVPAAEPVHDDTVNPLLTAGMIRFLRDRAAHVEGAVGVSGKYPVAGKVSLSRLLEAAGGLRPEADRAHVDILLANARRNGKRYQVDLARDRPEAILVAAQDQVTVNNRHTVADAAGVTLMGEVARPGTYDLRKGDTLLDVIDRAGGMTEIAYAPGTIFMREAERRRQLEQFRSAAQQLDLAVAGYYMKETGPEKHAEEIKVAQNIARELRNTQALGRITVEADPAALRANPDAAILLQPGDTIFVPRRSATVHVAGEVLSAAALQYQQGVKGEQYIAAAGGTTRYADEGRNFVVFPDGSASPLSRRIEWRGQRGIPAGSTIIVPRDPDPLDFLKVTASIGNIVSQLAVTSVAIAQVNRPYY